ncbi:unnamed protein product [Auanema sp. JU1783]|nr:unnamed protein product [Auanema sp. JU1783]
MGAYLEKPVTEKHLENGKSDEVQYGACTMQGWRANQEDAHNCILSLEEGWNMFAVYDGHGGSEVSQYTADHLPKFLKNKDFLKSSDSLTEAFQKLFVEFDDVLRSESVLDELKRIYEASKGSPAASIHSSDEDDRIKTIEESELPLEDLIMKYGVAVLNNGPLLTQKIVDMVGKNRKRKQSNDPTDDSKRSKNTAKLKKELAGDEKSEKVEEVEGDDAVGDVKESAEKDEKATAEEATEKHEDDDDEDDDSDYEYSATEDAEKPVKAGEGDAAGVSESESDDDEEDEDEAEGEEESGEDEEDDEEIDQRQFRLNRNVYDMGDIPGEDSGTTACVCFMSDTKIVVANIGDSRAVLCRAGKAIDLSVDHKPEDKIERDRIENAGGIVNEEGRVNGGLNLSRAFGDHSYKKNDSLPLQEQMISALPDVHIENRDVQDEFIVVACDGIWNSLKSQEVVDIVRLGFKEGKSCEQLSGELCDACLADSTAGDGTGCDNMTVIVIKIGSQ